VKSCFSDLLCASVFVQELHCLCVPLYIFGHRFLPQEMVSWLVILIAAPLMMTGFFRYNDMMFEQFAVEFFFHTFTPQKRVYFYEPPFMEFRKVYLAQELDEEIEKREEKSPIKRFLRKVGFKNG
jgi:hypothetical protein